MYGGRRQRRCRVESGDGTLLMAVAIAVERAGRETQRKRGANEEAEDEEAYDQGEEANLVVEKVGGGILNGT